MPSITFDTEVNTSKNIITSLKSKGDKIVFRVANNPFMEEVIIQQDGDGWKTLVVDRDSQANALKSEYIRMMQNAKAIEKEGDLLEADKLRKKARKIAPKLTFYIPILNRDTGEAQILRTTKSVFEGLKAQREAGRNLLETDFLLMRNEGDIPANYYFLDRQDAKEMSEADIREFEKAKTFEVEKILYPPATPSLDEMLVDEVDSLGDDMPF